MKRRTSLSRITKSWSAKGIAFAFGVVAAVAFGAGLVEFLRGGDYATRKAQHAEPVTTMAEVVFTSS